MKTVTLKRRALCQCGFTVLKEGIMIGTEYQIDPRTQGSGLLICGGCGAKLAVTLVQVAARGNVSGGNLPLEIFQEAMLQ